MTTQETTQAAAAVKEVAFENVDVEKIEVVENVRKHFDPAAMKELTESVRHKKVLVPLILATNGKPGVYRLIDGERRYRAAKAVGLKQVPARIIQVDAGDVTELQLLTTLHKAGLGPIEEARAFKKLLSGDKRNAEALAKQVDKSVKYVTRSVRLLELPRKAIDAIEKGALTPEHGHQILRVPEDRREKLVEFALSPKWGDGLPTVQELAAQIEQRIEKDLARACFPKDREYAGQVACSGCPFNTGNQNVLFEGAETGKCTNGGCFTKKTNLFLKEFKEKAAKQFEGLKCVGMGAAGYNGLREIKGAVVLSAEETKSEKVQALIAKDPEKFGFAVVKPASYGSKAPSAVLVCQDKELLEKKIRKPAEGDEHPLTQEERERDEFVQEAEVRALFAEGAKALKSIKKKHLVGIVQALNGTEEAYEAVGVAQSESPASALAKLPEKALLRLAYLCAIDHYNLDEEFQEIGVNSAKVRKEARKAALAEWQEALKAKAAEAKGTEVAATK